jgi:murein hydrolase activator
MTKKILPTFCFVFFVTATALAQPSNHYIQLSKAKLENVQNKILSLKLAISSKQAQRNSVNKELEQIEMVIGGGEKQFKKTNAALKKQSLLLQQTQQKHEKLNQQLSAQQHLLSEYVRAAYMLGRQQYLKMLLNQENPEKVNRFIQYYHYITSARMQTINAMKKTLKQLEANEQKIQKQAQKFQSIRALEGEQHQRLARQKTYRHKVLQQINQLLSNKQARLSQLVANKSNLELVIDHIEKKSYYYVPGHLFSDTKHQLPWPLRNGRIIQYFNTPIAGGRLHTSGILIKAPAGTKIHSIYKGKVVFSNWLRGFGLLTIIQHGKNFMTLYAHAQSLYVKVGNTVKPGQVIATVGNSGGYQQNALYFEIRHNGVALDPTQWLRKKG